jgi:hypothetical protein
MNRIFLMLLSFCFFAHAQAQSQSAIDEAWKGFSDPEIMSAGFTHKFSELPLAGTVEIGPKAWSGHYWPSREGGINFRWNSPKKETFNYKSPSKDMVMRMSLEELSRLAPTEKYDLLMSRYHFPLKTEAEGTARRNAPDWAGICHGWAPATLNHNEPSPKVLTNAEGVQIPFGASDIKALLSYYYAFYYEAESTHQVGLRCFFGRWMGGARACDEDLNAGAFHIVMANKLGIEKEGFVADVDRYKEVWNQPVVAYKSKVLASHLPPSKNAAKKAVKEMRIATEFFYIDELEVPTWDMVHGTTAQKIAKKDFVYRIELDAQGKIVGGEWESDDRPDFLWKKSKTDKFEGLLSDLNVLLND